MAGLAPGDRIDRYQIVARLGRGAMGEVFQAQGDQGLAVALKIFDPQHFEGQTSELIERFRREATALVRLAREAEIE